jgi:hypothetical protein
MHPRGFWDIPAMHENKGENPTATECIAAPLQVVQKDFLLQIYREYYVRSNEWGSLLLVVQASSGQVD